MTGHLTEVESLCQRSLQALESLQSSPSENLGNLIKRLQDLLPIIAESKKKIMVRSARGQELTKEVISNVSKLFKLVSLPSKDEKAVEEIVNRLKNVEGSVKNLEIYWKSFEYAIT